jgi:hypothetical protein
MKHPPERDWMIVAPWWQWTDPLTAVVGQPVTPDPAKGRLSPPIFQKYDSPKLVNDFIADPQRCLKFVDDDLVHALQPSPGPPLSQTKKLFRIGARKLSPDTAIDQRYVPDGTNTRMIFLNTHKRFYLVVCEIHCDGPGFPKVKREKICQAGFVIRRRLVEPPKCGVHEVKPILKSLASSRARLTRVNQFAEIESLALSAASGQGNVGVAKSPKLESLLKVRASLQALVASEKARFDEWVERTGVVPQLQGWYGSPQGFDQVGVWAPVDETPADLGLESYFPLYPLIPDKNAPKHAGQFGTIYFGILPTASHDCDRSGCARFDDRAFYEVRCWVQRHLEPHDPDQPCRCPDFLFWSVPTRPYKLASHFDLTGTSNRPVIIQLPDLDTLAAQAKPSLGVGFAKPPGSLMFSVDKDGKPQNPGRSSKFEICFFAIPLITIVATFVLELFLPVVILLFQLWWMLALKFCIPPELDVAAGITAELGADGRIGINADLTVDANVEFNIGASVDSSIISSIGSQFNVPTANALIATYSPIALANLEIDVNSASDPGSSGSPSVIANLDFETEVTHA